MIQKISSSAFEIFRLMGDHESFLCEVKDFHEHGNNYYLYEIYFEKVPTILILGERLDYMEYQGPNSIYISDEVPPLIKVGDNSPALPTDPKLYTDLLTKIEYFQDGITDYIRSIDEICASFTIKLVKLIRQFVNNEFTTYENDELYKRDDIINVRIDSRHYVILDSERIIMNYFVNEHNQIIKACIKIFESKHNFIHAKSEILTEITDSFIKYNNYFSIICNANNRKREVT